MLERKPQILDAAAELLQTRGYTGFSYQDLSDRLGITKASIHHHFATKDDLLLALVDRYRARLSASIRETDQKYSKPWDKLDVAFEEWSWIMQSGNKICPLGSLQAAFNVIPAQVQEEVQGLFRLLRGWLASVLDEGKSLGVMQFKGSAEDEAVLIIAALQGAVQIARAEGPQPFTGVVKQIRARLQNRA